MIESIINALARLMAEFLSGIIVQCSLARIVRKIFCKASIFDEEQEIGKMIWWWFLDFLSWAILVAIILKCFEVW